MKIDTFNLHRSRQKYVAKMGSRQLARRQLALRHLARRQLARRHLARRQLGRDLSTGDISPPTFRPIL